MLRERAFHVDHKSLCARYEHTYECASNFFRADTITYIMKRIVGGWVGRRFLFCLFILFMFLV